MENLCMESYFDKIKNWSQEFVATSIIQKGDIYISAVREREKTILLLS